VSVSHVFLYAALAAWVLTTFGLVHSLASRAAGRIN